MIASPNEEDPYLPLYSKVISRGTSTENSPNSDNEDTNPNKTFYSILNFSPQSFDKFKRNVKADKILEDKKRKRLVKLTN